MEDKYLRFEIIWKDEDMFELNVQANNGRYSGTTEVYEVSDSLIDFANELSGFPFGKDEISHACGKKDSYAYFEMRFYKIGPTGKCGVLITMEENVATEYRKEEKDKISLELIVEPNAIDTFQKALKSLAEKEEGIAELRGISSFTSNII
ncbi:hypothetical protein [Catalinimonas niigatensis]|uniref:hypothetical protein n=1 Tax=Catalinimonas niigatensis TaxID=1397264 RepID=UPI0026650544|nr:hypothetical protein [Catalinimonas niigatensis]WPP48471.1 hypothetical protein PZB72_17505 [Catalinimonas niigatensis]